MNQESKSEISTKDAEEVLKADLEKILEGNEEDEVENEEILLHKTLKEVIKEEELFVSFYMRWIYPKFPYRDILVEVEIAKALMLAIIDYLVLEDRSTHEEVYEKVRDKMKERIKELREKTGMSAHREGLKYDDIIK